jgi:predicted nuclease of predicted toxin-antitoxin system
MKVFFDNCTSPVMASTLHGYIANFGHAAVHIRDLPLRHPTDVQWIEHLAADRDDWIVITGDDRIRRNKPERIAFRQARLKGVVLAAAYQKTSMNRCCAVLVHQWPSLLETMSRFAPPVLLEMSINFSGKFKQLSL